MGINQNVRSDGAALRGWPSDSSSLGPGRSTPKRGHPRTRKLDSANHSAEANPRSTNMTTLRPGTLAGFGVLFALKSASGMIIVINPDATLAANAPALAAFNRAG